MGDTAKMRAGRLNLQRSLLPIVTIQQYLCHEQIYDPSRNQR